MCYNPLRFPEEVALAKKTKLMAQTERAHGGGPFERLFLPEMLNENGLTVNAADLEMNKAALGGSRLRVLVSVLRR